MENGGRTHLPNDKPSVLGELPNELVGRPGFRLLVVAVPDGTDLNAATTAARDLIEAVAAALEA